jgi:hypothetical protein
MMATTHRTTSSARINGDSSTPTTVNPIAFSQYGMIATQPFKELIFIDAIDLELSKTSSLLGQQGTNNIISPFHQSVNLNLIIPIKHLVKRK